MASNISQITNAITDLNVSFAEVNVTDMLNTAIVSSNDSSGGWIGLFVLAIFSFTIFIHIITNTNKFNIIERTTIYLVTLSIILDLMFFLFRLRILDSLQILVFVWTTYVIIGLFSFLKKEMNSEET